MSQKSLYSPENLRIMTHAEAIRRMRKSRVQELLEYARRADLHTIGIAHCTTFTREAEALEQEFTQAGFQVARVHCKYGHVPASDLVEEGKGTICNPAGQAQFLAEAGTEMNIVMGLCLGHDMVFNALSQVPTTTLIVKERK
jgi:uncharacterized metal-binding protein